MAYADASDPRALESKRRWYENNKQVVIERTKRVRKELREYVTKLKDVPCMDCGIRYPSWVMEFDHRDPEDKSSNIDKLIANGSMKKLLAELEKCDIVCANCHRFRTAKQRGWSE